MIKKRLQQLEKSFQKHTLIEGLYGDVRKTVEEKLNRLSDELKKEDDSNVIRILSAIPRPPLRGECSDARKSVEVKFNRFLDNLKAQNHEKY
jgi:ribosome-associated translation inhibitor RaiA